MNFLNLRKSVSPHHPLFSFWKTFLSSKILMIARKIIIRHLCLLFTFSRNFFPSPFIFNFSFRKNYRFMESCKDSTKKSLVLLTQLSPMFTSWIIIIQYQNHKTDLGTMYIDSSYFITCINSCIHHCDQDTELFHHYRDLQLSTFYQFEWNLETSPPFNLFCLLSFLYNYLKYLLHIC